MGAAGRRALDFSNTRTGLCVRKSPEAPICAPLVLMEAPPAVFAVDIETHDWREKRYTPTPAEKEEAARLLAARLDEAASKCNAQAGPCVQCRIRALQTGQFGRRHLFCGSSMYKPWELKYSRVVQLGVVVSDAEGNVLRRFERCISDVPGGCSAKATKYHGLTNEQLAEVHRAVSTCGEIPPEEVRVDVLTAQRPSKDDDLRAALDHQLEQREI